MMAQLPLNIQKAIRRYESIETEGLTLYPVRVSEYDEFTAARPALEVLQQSFPVRLMSLPLLSAMYRMDYEATVEGETPSGLFFRALLGLALSLRLGEGEAAERRVKRLEVYVDPKDPGKLTALRFLRNGEEYCEITPVQYQRLRPILAAQNGVKLESETANPELVQAERDLAEANGAKLEGGIENLISSVAALTGAEEADIDDWPILKLQNRAAALKRAMDYIICGVGESQGTSWKGGNPSPHPFFARAQGARAGVAALDGFMNGAALSAVEHAGQQTAI